MTRDELIEAISADARITRAVADRALRAFCDRVGAALACGEDVKLFGFGRFEAHVRPAYQGWNPRTRMPVVVAAKPRARFHMSTALERRLAPLLVHSAAR